LILIDTNLLLYAEDSLSPHHVTAGAWLEEKLSGSSPVGLCWPVINGFIRISTNHRLHKHPLSILEAIEVAEGWLNQPCVSLLQPTDQHWRIFQMMLKTGAASGNLVSDAHLAALAIEHNATLWSSDLDFARFSGLKWKNPFKRDQG